MAAQLEILDGESQELRRSPEFWFKTGNFIFVASGAVAYRVHGDVVGRQSKVFRDLLELNEIPRPDSEQTVDGCPVVHITDSPDEFNTFLSFLYDGFEHIRRYVQEPRWATVKVMILLGDKYDVPAIREEGLRQLRAWYSEDIDEWDKRDEAFFAHETDHISVASITHALGEPELHKAVLYHCCRLSPSELVVARPDSGCLPLCADDLIYTLKLVKKMPRMLHAALALVFGDTLFGKLSACTECGPVCHLVKTAAEDHVAQHIDHDAYQLLDISIWSPLSIEVEKHLCRQCFLHYQSWLWRVRLFYRRSGLPSLYISP